MRILKLFGFIMAMTVTLIGALPARAAGVPNQGTWESTLLGRDIDLNAVAATSDAAVYLYDKTLDVTWLRDANRNEQKNWDTAMSWASNLVTGSGATAISDWRLPTAAVSGYDVPGGSSEMASLFFDTLGNSGDGVTNVGSFLNIQSYVYWLGAECGPDISGCAFGFKTFSPGTWGVGQDRYVTYGSYYAMAVRSGDVMAAVPEPETYAMLLAGLGLIGVVSRRRTTKSIV
jgi:hypothetical protein